MYYVAWRDYDGGGIHEFEETPEGLSKALEQANASRKDEGRTGEMFLGIIRGQRVSTTINEHGRVEIGDQPNAIVGFDWDWKPGAIFTVTADVPKDVVALIEAKNKRFQENMLAALAEKLFDVPIEGEWVE